MEFRLGLQLNHVAFKLGHISTWHLSLDLGHATCHLKLNIDLINHMVPRLGLDLSHVTKLINYIHLILGYLSR